MGHDLNHITGPRPRTIRPPKPHDGWTKAQLWARILALEEKLHAVHTRSLDAARYAHGQGNDFTPGGRLQWRLARDDAQLTAETAVLVSTHEDGPRAQVCGAACRCRNCMKNRRGDE